MALTGAPHRDLVSTIPYAVWGHKVRGAYLASEQPLIWFLVASLPDATHTVTAALDGTLVEVFRWHDLETAHRHAHQLAVNKRSEPKAPVLPTNEQLLAYEQGDLPQHAVLELFQQLVDTGLVWRLPTHFGRTARGLMSQGLITPRQQPARLAIAATSHKEHQPS